LTVLARGLVTVMDWDLPPQTVMDWDWERG